MIYGYIVKKEIRKTFDHVNNHRWDEAVKAVANYRAAHNNEEGVLEIIDKVLNGEAPFA